MMKKTSVPFISPQAWLRLAIIAGMLAVWEAVARSGLLFQDVVPPLSRIVAALFKVLGKGQLFSNLGITALEVAAALAIGGIAGLVVGIALGGSPYLRKTYLAYVYYLGPTPKIIFFPVMLLWFGVGPGSKVAMGALSCFFPVALSAIAGMQEIDQALIKVGRSFRATAWQMAIKIYLPAMRAPMINGLRLGLGIAIIGVLLAETKLSNQGLGFLIIQSYTTFNMPQMYALLLIVFIIAIGANGLIDRLNSARR